MGLCRRLAGLGLAGQNRAPAHTHIRTCRQEALVLLGFSSSRSFVLVPHSLKAVHLMQDHYSCRRCFMKPKLSIASRPGMGSCKTVSNLNLPSSAGFVNPPWSCADCPLPVGFPAGLPRGKAEVAGPEGFNDVSSGRHVMSTS